MNSNRTESFPICDHHIFTVSITSFHPYLIYIINSNAYSTALKSDQVGVGLPGQGLHADAGLNTGSQMYLSYA